MSYWAHKKLLTIIVTRDFFSMICSKFIIFVVEINSHSFWFWHRTCLYLLCSVLARGILIFPILHDSLCFSPKCCIDYCCEMFCGVLHIPRNISQQWFMQNLEDKQHIKWNNLKFPASQQLLFVFLQEWNMGQRASDTRGITFEDVVVPKEVSYSILLFTLVSKDSRKGCTARTFWGIIKSLVLLGRNFCDTLCCRPSLVVDLWLETEFSTINLTTILSTFITDH